MVNDRVRVVKQYKDIFTQENATYTSTAQLSNKSQNKSEKK